MTTVDPVIGQKDSVFREWIRLLAATMPSRRNAIYSLSEYAILPILHLAATPLLIRHLGFDLYGIWMLINAAVGLVGAVDLGLGESTIRFVSLHRGRGDRAAICRTIRTAVWTSVPLTMGLGLGVFCAAPLLSEHAFAIPIEYRMIAVQSFQIGAALVVIRMIDSIFAGAFRGYERYDFAALTSISIRVATLCAAVMMAVLGLGLQEILLASVGLSLLGLLVEGEILRHLMRTSPWRPSIDRREFLRMFEFGGYAWLHGTAWLVFSQADRIIIGAFLGTSALGLYSVCMQLAQPVHGIIGAGFSAVFPAISRRFGTMNRSEIQREVSHLIQLNLGSAVLLALPIMYFSETILTLWLGQDFMLQGNIVFRFLVAGSFIQATGVVPYFVLLGLGEAKFVSLTTLAGMAVMLLGTLALLPLTEIYAPAIGRLLGGGIAYANYVRLVKAVRQDDRHSLESPRAEKTAVETTSCGRRNSNWGVSIIVCSHNGAVRLPNTLTHLAGQQVTHDLRWEVVVIDNASTDDTVEVAQRSWPSGASGALKVVSEPRLGLTYARCRGFEEAQYEVVSFVDDDNWVSRDWVQLTSYIMAGDPHIGACGGSAEAECEAPPPSWFEQFRSSYAVGPQSEQAGDITWSKGYLWGAGLTVRKSAWQHLQRLGFRFVLTDRKGSELHSGGDMELCYALRLAGWTIWYEPHLTMRHYVPASRLTWNYLKNMHRGFGASTAILKAYSAKRNEHGADIQARLRGAWWCQAGVCAVRITGQLFRLLIAPPIREGHSAVLELESLIATFTELVRRRTSYDAMFRNTQHLFLNQPQSHIPKAI